MAYFLEGLLLRGLNVAIVGESGSGKSWLMGHVIYQDMRRFLGQLTIQQMIFFQNSTVKSV